MTSRGQKPEMLLNLLQCTGQAAPGRTVWPQMSRAPRLRNPALDHEFHALGTASIQEVTTGSVYESHAMTWIIQGDFSVTFWALKRCSALEGTCHWWQPHERLTVKGSSQSSCDSEIWEAQVLNSRNKFLFSSHCISLECYVGSRAHGSDTFVVLCFNTLCWNGYKGISLINLGSNTQERAKEHTHTHMFFVLERGFQV